MAEREEELKSLSMRVKEESEKAGLKLSIKKINSKWIKALNVRPEPIKLLEENIGKTPPDISHSKILYDPPPRVMEIKAKINKGELIKFKSFFTMKETISKMKRQPLQ